MISLVQNDTEPSLRSLRSLRLNHPKEIYIWHSATQTWRKTISYDCGRSTCTETIVRDKNFRFLRVERSKNALAKLNRGRTKRTSLRTGRSGRLP